MGDRAVEGGSEPGLAAGERPGVGDAAVAVSSVAPGSAIAAVVKE